MKLNKSYKSLYNKKSSSLKENMNIKRVGDLKDERYQFIDNSSIVEDMNKDFTANYDSYFVIIGKGGYEEVWGMYGIIPKIDKKVYKVHPDDLEVMRGPVFIPKLESVIKEKKWSAGVETKWHPPEDLFASGTAEEIANSASRGHNGDKGKAIKAISFYKNRAGKNLSNSRKSVLDSAINILQKREKKSENVVDKSTIKIVRYESRFKRIKEMTDGSPKIYVADLAAYNSGNLKGEWLNLANFSDGEEVAQAIEKITGDNEYAIHDTENIPSEFYHEGMGKEDFDRIIKLYKSQEETGIPMQVAIKFASEYMSRGWTVDDLANEIGDRFYGKYDDIKSFAENLMDEGLIPQDWIVGSFYVSDTDRRIIAQEEADNYLENEGLSEDDLKTNEEASKIYDEIHDSWMEGLNSDPMGFLVDTQGFYTEEEFMKYWREGKIPFIQIDMDDIARYLDYSGDFDFIEFDGDTYVFSSR